jgi:hypothetical protein
MVGHATNIYSKTAGERRYENYLIVQYRMNKNLKTKVVTKCTLATSEL